jgi:4-amino-4-deoxy-L-arabinose transferase-like glycosyltransferase
VTGEEPEAHDAARSQASGQKDRVSLSPLLIGVVLFLVAFTLRLVAARIFAGEPVWDGHYYDFGARRIAEGHGYSDDRMIGGHLEWHPWCHYPVGYSGYLSAFYMLFGMHAWVPHFANALSGGLMAPVVYGLGRHALSERRARLAGLFTAIHPGLVLYGALVMGEVLSALLTMTAFWITLALSGVNRGGDSNRGIARSSGFAGVAGVAGLAGLAGLAVGAFVLGVGALVRPQALLCAPMLGFALPSRVFDGRLAGRPSARLAARALAAVLACVLALVPVLPWTARNCRVMDGCALVSTNAGWNLAIGAFPRATGRFETLRSSDGCTDVTGQVQQDRCWLAYGIEHIKRAPGRWLGLIPAKLSNTFDHESFAIEYLREARPHDWPEARRVAYRDALSMVHRLLVVISPLALVALFSRRRLRGAAAIQAVLVVGILVAAYFGMHLPSPTVWPAVLVTCVLACLPLPGRPPCGPGLLLPIGLLATTALTHAVFFGDDRYHMVISPALCLLAAAALRRSDPTPEPR